MKILPLLLALATFFPVAVSAEEIPLKDISKSQLINTVAEVTTYRGFPALKLSEKDPNMPEALAILRNRTFHNGTIDVEVSGAPARTAADSARGFIGIAFHMQADRSHYECIYIRPTNGRASDQLRRNHATQYESEPDWPWDRLRKESPGVYESYADMTAGEWTHIRIVVHGTDASLYVGNASQPCLLIHDLKLGDTQGAIALWYGPGTEGYFRNLNITDEGAK